MVRNSLLSCIVLLITFPALSTHIRGGFIKIKSVQGLTVTFEFVGFQDRGSNILFGNGYFDFGDGEFLEADFQREVQVISDDLAVMSFQVNHTYPSVGSYTVSYREENRNPNTMNMQTSVNTPFYVETSFMMDPFLPNNFPDIYPEVTTSGLIGKAYEVAIRVQDADNNLLTFEKWVPRQGRNNPMDDYRFPNHAAFYSNPDQGNEDQTGLPTYEIGRFTGNIRWDAPGDLIFADSREYTLATRITEWRQVDDQWLVLSRTVVDYQVFLEEEGEQATFPEVTLPGVLCFENDWAFSLEGNDSVYLEVDVPFLQSENGIPFNELDSQWIYGDTSFQLSLKEDYETSEGFFYGNLKISNEFITKSFNVLFTNDCESVENFEAFIASVGDQRQEVLIYPNPSNGKFHLICSQPNILTTRILSLSGSMITEAQLTNHSLTLDLQNQLKPGVYLLQLLDGSASPVTVKRLIIEDK